MTMDKAAKRAIRARMAKTGERYTTARLYALDLHHAPGDEPKPTPLYDEAASGPNAADAAPATILPPRVAEPGVSDESVLKATGKDWDEWFALLDAWGATDKTHTEIARHVYETHGISGWWAQSVTVGYERARGMRAVHERPDGFSASVSRTFPIPRERLFAAIVDDEERPRWLDGVALRQRTSVPGKSARFDVLGTDARLNLYLTARGPEKTAVQLQIERLPDAAAVVTAKSSWKAQLARLAAYLERKTGD